MTQTQANNQKQIWIIDDDKSIRRILQIALEREGYAVKGLVSADNALQALELTTAPDLIFCDVRMPGTSGLGFLDRIDAANAEFPVIIMTAHSDLDATVSAYSHGAFDYLPKPFDIKHVIKITQSALLASEKNRKHETAAAPKVETSTIIGDSPAMQDVYRIIGRLHNSSINVLITGETGTGKELVAQALHQNSPRKSTPFIAINTAAIPKDLLESEIFGHEKGAFTGATSQRKGRFEQADGGTLFLDEIGDMPLELQTRLLRVLAEGEFYRVGGHQPVKVNVRIIAATHQDLHARASKGEFREDLYHRLNVIRLEIPPLRARQTDIPQLLSHYLAKVAKELNEEPKKLHAATQAALEQYAWPGNVRQLENVVRSITVMTSGHRVGMQDLPLALLPDFAASEPSDHSESTLSACVGSAGNPEVSPSLDEACEHQRDRDWQSNAANRASSEVHARSSQSGDWLEIAKQQIIGQLTTDPENHNIGNEMVKQLEKQLIEAALEVTDGLKQEAAKRLGWGRNTLTRKMKELGIEH